MNWQEICDEPAFKELPFKIAANKWGKIEMSPASNEHGMYQVAVIELFLKLCKNGRPVSECSIQTAEGVKVADVGWGSYDFFRKHGRSNPYAESPEIVVEILSPSNTLLEMQEKKKLYFDKAAKEFWICEKNGNMRFHTEEKELYRSEIVRDFPLQICIDFA